MATESLRMEAIHEKVINGDSLTDAEVEYGINKFTELADKLNVAGKMFRIAFYEANRVHLTLRGFAHARGLKVNW